MSDLTVWQRVGSDGRPTNAPNPDGECSGSIGGWRRLLLLKRFVLPHRRSFGLAIALLLLNAGLRLPVPFLSIYLIDTVIPHKDVKGLFWFSLLIILMSVLFVVVDSIKGYVVAMTSRKISARMETYLLDRVQKLPISYLMAKDVGYIISRFVNDLSSLNSFFSDTILNGIQQLAILLIGLFAIFHIHVKLALVSLCVLPGFIVLNAFYGDKLKQQAKFAQEKRAEALEVLTEAVAGVFVTKVFARERWELLRVFKKRAAVIRIEMRNYVRSAWSSSWVSILGTMGPLIVLCYGGYEIIHGRLTIGGLMGFNSVLGYLHGPTQSLTSIYLGMQNALASLDRVTELAEMDPEAGLRTNVDKRVGVPADLKGSIRFDRVSFGYDRSRLALRDVSFHIRPGSVTAIVGDNGAGKSSVVNLLFRLYEPDEGQVSIDGIDIRKYDLASLRRAIGLVSSGTVLFAGSVFDNIRFGRSDATPEEVINAAKLAHADGFISSLPCGYNTTVGRMGFQLSAGQRQRIALARTVLSQPKILILDEATSSVDLQSEQLIWDSLVAVAPGRTTVVISHMPSSILRADTVIRLHLGRVVDIVSHVDFVSREECRSPYPHQIISTGQENDT
jgi:ABC-type bacteriocin/lantibiotic exporter with double-glycine peptidase domain